MSNTREIAKGEWNRFFKELTQSEKNHKVRVENETLLTGDQALVTGVPFVGLSCEEKGSQAASVDLTVAASGSDFTHRISNARAVYVEEEDDGTIKCLDIEGDGKTLIYFD